MNKFKDTGHKLLFNDKENTMIVRMIYKDDGPASVRDFTIQFDEEEFNFVKNYIHKNNKEESHNG